MVDIQKARKSFELLAKSAKEVADVDLRDFDGFFDLKAALMDYWEERTDKLMTVGKLVYVLQKFKENAVVCFYDYNEEGGWVVRDAFTVTDKASPYFKGDNWWYGHKGLPDAMVCISDRIGMNKSAEDIAGNFGISDDEARKEFEKMEKLRRKETDNG